MNFLNLVRGEFFPSLSNKILIYYDNLYCDPNSITDGDTVYCDTHQILRFKEILNIKKDLIIITHNSDHYLCDGKPWDSNGINVEEFTCYKKWYGQNSYSSKVIPIPIGFENIRWESTFGPKTHWLNGARNVPIEIEPTSLVYLNCNKNTNFGERQKCYDECSKMGDIVNIDNPDLTYPQYLDRIKEHMFVLSPRGNGLDCHRTWEVLMMRRVPILKREGKLEELYDNIPVLFVNDWEDLEQLNLEDIYKRFSFKNQEYLKFNFWNVKTGEFNASAKH